MSISWAFHPRTHSFITVELGRFIENFKVVCIWLSLGTSFGMRSGLPEISSRVGPCSARPARLASWGTCGVVGLCSLQQQLCPLKPCGRTRVS